MWRGNPRIGAPIREHVVTSNDLGHKRLHVCPQIRRTADRRARQLRLTSQLSGKHVPQGEAESDSKVGLDDGKIDQADAPGNESQAGVVKEVVGNQQEKEPTERADYAAQKVR